MSRYRLSPAARNDLEQIWSFGEERWGADRAERYLREIQHLLESLASGRRQGRSCETIRAGYFKAPVGAHVIFYRLYGGDVDVSRILHQRMDFDRHL